MPGLGRSRKRRPWTKAVPRSGGVRPTTTRRVVDFLLSEPFQEDIPLRMFVFPVLEGVELPPVFERWAPRVPDPLSLPAERIAAEREAWVKRWTDVMFG